jgi:hypothetical protein
MISCEQAARLSSESHDNSLSLRDRVSLRLHLIGCRLCSRYAHQLKFLRDTCARVDEESAGSTQLPGDARERIRQRLKQG